MKRGRLLLFVCTGNVCRSPMAEYLMRRRLGPSSGWAVVSAGVAALEGMTASRNAIDVLAEQGVDMTGHRSRQLTGDLVDAANVIVVMTASHRDQMRILFRDAREKVFLLRSFDPAADSVDVEDPIGADVGTYRQIRDTIESALPGLNEFLRGLHL
jgi:protein-tyrosine-phosphatase